MTQLDSNSKHLIVYFSHGGGPLPLLNDPGHAAMIQFMKSLPDRLIAPKAIIVLSAHWEEPQVTLQTNPRPSMYYDYYGFPPEMYQVQYPAPGCPALAEEVETALLARGIPCTRDDDRGFDHGHFIPLLLMYPEANIPTIQISLIRGLDPEAHLRMGEALRPLLGQGVLFIGSGFSFHNLRTFNWKAYQQADPLNDTFQDWLVETCCRTEKYTETFRRLKEWSQAPNARYAHPREEHLLPLMVCAGLAGRRGTLLFDDYILSKRGVAFGW